MSEKKKNSGVRKTGTSGKNSSGAYTDRQRKTSDSGAPARNAAAARQSDNSSRRQPSGGARPQHTGPSDSVRRSSGGTGSSQARSGGAGKQPSGGARSSQTKSAGPAVRKNGVSGQSASRKNTGSSASSGKPAASGKTAAGRATSVQKSGKAAADTKSGKTASGTRVDAKKNNASGSGKNAQAAKQKGVSAAERTVMQREESRRRIGDEQLRNSPAAAKLEHDRALRIYKRNEKLYKVIYFISMALVVVCCAFLLSFSVLFHINTINVNVGEGVPYTEEQILEYSGIEVGNNLLSISTGKAEEDIAYNLPYIGNITVKRELPNTVNINAEAANVLGMALNNEKQLVVLGADGKVLEVLHGNNPAGMPIINGLTINRTEVGRKAEMEKPEQFETAAQVIECFRNFDVELESISFSPIGNTVTAVYDKRLNIKLGTVSDIEEKAELVSTLIHQGKISPYETGTLDMTIQGRAIFRPDYVTDNSGELDYVYDDKGQPDELYMAELAGTQSDAVMG